jgi:diphthine synthase
MLYLIGLGLVEEDVTLKGMEKMKQSDEIYCELYTNKWMGDLKRLEERVGKKILILSRQETEGNFIIERAKAKNIALLISGDPLTATTHFELVFEAKKENIKCEVVHAPSIYTSIAETGLQLYKFGRATTLVHPQKNYSPKSPYDIICKNKEMGLHTLVLLDIQDDNLMTAKEGLHVLLDLEESEKKLVFSNESKAAVCCMLGSPDKVIKYGKILDLLSDESIDKTPAVIIIPGELNFKEEEALEIWK